jgi:hypothetical protein
MNIRIAKGERFIKLTKRERLLLKDAKNLLVELAKQDEPGLSNVADTAADRIGEVERCLDMPVVLDPPS